VRAGSKSRGHARRKRRGSVSADQCILAVHVPLKLHRRGGRKLIVSPDGVIALPRRTRIDSTLVKALARAFRWQRLI
jgi:hypothetical protein